jgi:phage terminase large subunit-like protein
MFGRKGRKGKGTAAAAEVTAAQATRFEVWYQTQPTHPWYFCTVTDTRRAAEHAAATFTTARTDIREY